MFKKLKIQLTMINLIALSIVLIIIFSGIYTLMKSSLTNQAKGRMALVARTERIFNRNNVRDLPPNEDRRVISNCFYIKTDYYGSIKEISTNVSIPTLEATALVKDTIKNSKHEGTIKYKNSQLMYLVTPKPYGFIIVFLEKSADNDFLSGLIIVSIIIGSASILMVLAISLLLANRALIPIKNSWEKQRAFVADASHELRTPLAVMSTNLEIVLDNKEDSIESQSKWLENIQSEVKSMSKLVEELLFLARSDSNSEAIQMVSYSLSHSLVQIAEIFKPFALEKGITLDQMIKPNVTFFGNEGRIKQLVTILIDNAIQHTFEGGKITVTLRELDSAIEISVSDTGTGIPMEHINKIFERFYKVDKSRSGNGSGSGLGLSIAECIAKEHNGTIKVSSVVDQGSVFQVTLPKNNA